MSDAQSTDYGGGAFSEMSMRVAGEVWHSPQAFYATIDALRARVQTALVRADEAYEAADTTIFGLSFRPHTAVHAKFTSGGTLGPC